MSIINILFRGRMVLSKCRRVPVIIRPWSFPDAAPCFERVIFSSVIIGIKKFLEPLQEFKVILETSLYQFIYWYTLQSGVSYEFQLNSYQIKGTTILRELPDVSPSEFVETGYDKRSPVFDSWHGLENTVNPQNQIFSYKQKW